MKNLSFWIVTTIAFLSLTPLAMCQGEPRADNNTFMSDDGTMYEAVFVSIEELGLNEHSNYLELLKVAKEKRGLAPLPWPTRQLFEKIDLVGKGHVNLATEAFPMPNSASTLNVYQLWEMKSNDAWQYMDRYEMVASWTSQSKGSITYHEFGKLSSSVLEAKWVFAKKM